MVNWSATIAWQHWLRKAETSPAEFVSRSCGRSRQPNNVSESFQHVNTSFASHVFDSGDQTKISTRPSSEDARSAARNQTSSFRADTGSTEERKRYSSSTTSVQHWPGNRADISTEEEENVRSEETASTHTRFQVRPIPSTTPSSGWTTSVRTYTTGMAKQEMSTSGSSSTSMGTCIPDEQSIMEPTYVPELCIKTRGLLLCSWSFIFCLYYFY